MGKIVREQRLVRRPSLNEPPPARVCEAKAQRDRAIGRAHRDDGYSMAAIARMAKIHDYTMSKVTKVGGETVMSRSAPSLFARARSVSSAAQTARRDSPVVADSAPSELAFKNPKREYASSLFRCSGCRAHNRSSPIPMTPCRIVPVATCV